MLSVERLNAALNGRYTVQREIGAGGMATVYQAEDAKHHRNVALKVLRPEVATTLGGGRFIHEIEIAARLQHPGILPLLDSGDSDGFLWYVMPLIDGETLRARLLRERELPIPDAVRILTEVVDALAEAHRRGVIHRDIKPENILMAGRHALVADFGVAKAINDATGRHQVTTAGVALGTPGYMAPEQASAEPNLDHRVDIYAAGVIAYEMLTGRLPFVGTSAAQVLAKQVTDPPAPVGRERPTVSPQLEAVIMKCLATRPADRWQTADALVAQLEPFATTPASAITPAAPRPRHMRLRRWRLAGLGAAAGIALVTFATVVSRARIEERMEFGSVRPLTSDPGLALEPAVSPDGKLVAYVAGTIGQFRIYVRSAAGGTAVPVATDLPGDQVSPRWSPDGTRLLFVRGGALRVVPNMGGMPRILVDRATYGVWSPDGKAIAFCRADTVFIRGADGGPERVLAFGLEQPHSLAWSPNGKLIALVSGNAEFLPGRGISLGNNSPSRLMVIPLTGGQPVPLTDRRFLRLSPAWMPGSNRLLFVSSQDGGHDIYSLTLTASGRPRGAAQRLTTGLDIGTFSVSADARFLVYSSFPNRANIWAVPITSGRAFTRADATPVTAETQRIEGVAVSRDGQWIAFDSDRQSNNPGIYRMPLRGGEPRQVTGGRYDFMPAFSPRGNEVVFHSWRNENRDVYVVSVEGGEEKLVAGGPDQEMYPDWSPDGHSVVFMRVGTGRRELFLVSRDTSGRWGVPRQLTHDGGFPRWSPDGRWILFPRGRSLWLVSPAGGVPRALFTANPPGPDNIPPGFAIWSPDSRQVYYRGRWGDVESFWSVPVQGGKPTLLGRVESPTFQMASFMFATDGKRLFFSVRDNQSDLKTMDILVRK